MSEQQVGSTIVCLGCRRSERVRHYFNQAFDVQHELAEHLDACSACQHEMDCATYERLVRQEEHARLRALDVNLKAPSDGYIKSVAALENDVDLLLAFIVRNNPDNQVDTEVKAAIERARDHLATYGRSDHRM